MDEPHALDDPVKKRRVVRLLLLLAPALFAFCYVLAWLQGADTRSAVIIAAAGAVMSLGTAVVIHFMGSKSWIALVAVKLALMLVGRR